MLDREKVRLLAMTLKRLGYIDVEQSSPDDFWDEAVDHFLQALAELGWTLHTDGQAGD